MRLTRKLEKPIETKYLHYDYMRIADYDISRGNYGRITDAEIYNKLGRLEDIEEDLGIDLITFFKIYNADKVYIKGKKYYWKIKHYNRHSISVGTNKIICLSFKDYGKTWALTKEELE